MYFLATLIWIGLFNIGDIFLTLSLWIFSFSGDNLLLTGSEVSVGVTTVLSLPVEINASKRGLAILQAQYLNENEYAGACATLASMLRILFMILSSSNRDSN